MTSKEFYIINYQFDPKIPLFFRPYWLNAVCGAANWHIILYPDTHNVEAFFIYYKKEKLGFSYIVNPPFTPYTGLWIFNENYKSNSQALSYYNKVVSYFILQLPKVSFLSFKLHPRFESWLPFFWSNFKQSTMYTNELYAISEIGKFPGYFEYNKRKQIQKAEKNLIVKFNLNAADFYNHHKSSLLQQKKSILYPATLLDKICNVSEKHSCGFTIYIVDLQNNIHAALLVVWDKYAAYALISSIHPEYKKSGAGDLVFYRAIGHAVSFTNTFNFEGSMLCNVAKSFQKFNPELLPYHYLYKINNPILKFVNNLKPLV